VKRSAPLSRGKKRMRQYSPARAREMAKYRKEAKEFIRWHREAGILCPVALALMENKEPRPSDYQVEDVHHKKGRVGKLLRDQRYWLAVSRWGHEFIHSHPNIARKMGWLI